MYCKKCGCELNEGDTFCTKCGSRISSIIEYNLNTIEIKSGDTSKIVKYGLLSKKATFIIIALIIILVGIGCIIKSISNSPEKTIEKMVSALNDKDLDGVLNCYSPHTVSDYKGLMGAADLLIDALDVDVDPERLSEFAVSLADIPNTKISIKDIEYYSSDNTKKTGLPPLLANEFCKKAIVTVDIYQNNTFFETKDIELRKYDNDWLIEDNIFR